MAEPDRGESEPALSLFAHPPQGIGKIPAGIAEAARFLEAMLQGESVEFALVELVRRFGVNGLPLGEGKGAAAKVDIDGLFFPAYEKTLDGACPGIVGTVILETRQIEISAQLVVDATQDVDVEPGSHAEGIVVRLNDRAEVFLEVETDEHQITVVRCIPQAREELAGLRWGKIPYVGAEK